MKIQKSFKDDQTSGKLYLVPTPLGNLQDITLRALEILKSVDFVAAEDTRKTGILLKHFDLSVRQISFHEHNSEQKIPDLLDLLKSGKSLAQVSDAGMPSISDPGHDLVKAALAENLPVIALPGPSAGLTALIASGLAPQPHIFYGFLPRKAGQQKRFLEEKKAYPETQIFYESPYRIKETLGNIMAVYGDRQLVLVRELTKIFEEYQRGKVSEILTHLEAVPAKGECLLLVAGADAAEKSQELLAADPLAAIESLLEQGYKPNQAIKQVAKQQGLNRQELYQRYHDLT